MEDYGGRQTNYQSAEKMAASSKAKNRMDSNWGLSDEEVRSIIDEAIDRQSEDYMKYMSEMYEAYGLNIERQLPKSEVVRWMREEVAHRIGITKSCPRCRAERKKGQYPLHPCPDCHRAYNELESYVTAMLFDYEVGYRPIHDVEQLKIWYSMHRSERESWIRDRYIRDGLPFQNALENDAVLQRLNAFEKGDGNVLNYADHIRLQAACYKHALILGNKSANWEVDKSWIETLRKESGTPSTDGNITSAWDGMVKGTTPRMDRLDLGYPRKGKPMKDVYECTILMMKDYPELRKKVHMQYVEACGDKGLLPKNYSELLDNDSLHY